MNKNPHQCFAEELSTLVAGNSYNDKNLTTLPAEICALLESWNGVNVLWADGKGKVWAHILSSKQKIVMPTQADGIHPRLFSVFSTPRGKFTLEEWHIPEPCQILIQTVFANDNRRIGALIMYWETLANSDNNQKENIIEEAQFMTTICLPPLTLWQRHCTMLEHEERVQQAQMVKTALNALSVSELEAVVHIFRALKATEGTLVAGKIADGLGITRSIVVNALRKLESASIIETRSMGAKGTNIRVLNPLWVEELKRW